MTKVFDASHVPFGEIFRQLKHPIEMGDTPPYIFNGVDGVNDEKRLQVTLEIPKRAKGQEPEPLLVFLDRVKKALTKHKLLERGQDLSDTTILYSDTGCSRQMPHTDYLPHPSLSDALAEGREPLLVLISLMEGTKIDVWPNSTGCLEPECVEDAALNRQTVELGVGDVLVFKPDLIHAGSCFASPNVRMHAYIDTPAVRRRANRTYVIARHAPEALKARVGP